jgi:hypothetical protein
MRIFLHIVNTWFLSVLVCGAAITVLLVYPEHGFMGDENIFTTFFITVLVGSLGGLPSLLLSWSFLSLIVDSPLQFNWKIVCWYGAVMLAILFNLQLIALFAGGLAGIEVVVFAWPVYAVVFVILTIRIKQFLLLIEYYSVKN